MTSEALGCRVSKMIFLLFGYDSDMICCYNLFMAWFCSYDFDMVSVMNWDGSKLRFWWVKIVFLLFWGVFCFLSWTCLEHISISYQNRVKIVSKPYQIYIKTKSLSRGWFFFFFRSQPIGNCEKAVRSHTISKSWAKIQFVPKSYLKSVS